MSNHWKTVAPFLPGGLNFSLSFWRASRASLSVSVSLSAILAWRTACLAKKSCQVSPCRWRLFGAGLGGLRVGWQGAGELTGEGAERASEGGARVGGGGA